jgi:hypothetical protein
VVRGEEEAWARRWTAVTPAAAINAGGSVRGRFRERKGAGRLEAASIECSAHWREGEAARGGEGQWAAGAAGRWGSAWRWETALTGRPHLSAARESEGEVAGRFVKWAGCWFGPRVKGKEKKTSWAGLARELGEAQLFCFF